jgi:putative Mg2+ transporter-C (MgtC) family protein
MMDLTAELWLTLHALLAAFFGAIIGLQRVREGHEAGVRTHAAVAIGACLFGLIGGDHRVAAQVVSGIGFIGAGVILHAGRRGQHVKGLTTAATLWATAAIGLTISYHHYLLATFCTVLILGMLALPHLPGYRTLTRADANEAVLHKPAHPVAAPPVDAKEPT